MIFSNSRSNANSPYNLGLSLTLVDNSKIEALFRTKLVRFAGDLKLNWNDLQEIQFESVFTDVEFDKQIPDENELSFINKYFYPVIFSEIKKTGNSNVDFKVRFAFTLDSSLTNSVTNSGISFGVLLLGNQPVLYYIHVDIQEIIAVVKAK
jgi:hypothetical protein